MKVVLVGDSSVGKTSILRKYIGGSFTQEHLTTIGTDFMSKYLEIKNI